MNRTSIFSGLALVAALLTLPALAQPGPGMGGMGGMGPGMAAGGMGPGAGPRHGPRDCAQAPHPDQCRQHQEARRQAHANCQGKVGIERRQCLQAQRPPRDCSQAPDPQRCAARQQAREACRDKVGPERRQCMQGARQAPRPAP